MFLFSPLWSPPNPLAPAVTLLHIIYVTSIISNANLGQTQEEILDFQSALLVKDNFTLVSNHWSEYISTLIDYYRHNTQFILLYFEETPIEYVFIGNVPLIFSL